MPARWAWKEGTEMLEQVVRLTVNFVVKGEQLEEFKSIAQAMTAVSRAEPGTLGYEWFASADGKRFRLVENYVDSSAIEAHFMGPAVQQLVPKTGGSLQSRRIRNLRRSGAEGSRDGRRIWGGRLPVLAGDQSLRFKPQCVVHSS
jgi:quinol monooxygenase YgiN